MVKIKTIVRDDIISLDCYVDAEFKYKRYIEIIAGCGGYCFLDQFERLWKDEGGKYLAKKMEKAKLIKTDYFSRYKFIRLSSNALKYLYYRDDERDFSDIPKNKISIQNLSSNPSEKVLFSSVMNFELIQSNPKNTFLMKDKHIEFLEKNFKIDNSSKIDTLESEMQKIETEYFKYEFAVNSQESIYERLKKKRDILNHEIIEFKKQIKHLEENKSFINRNDKKIENISEKVEKLKEELSIISKDLSEMNNIINKKIELAKSYHLKKEKVENLRKNEIEKNKSVDVIIDKLISVRDISKIICIPTIQEDGYAHVLLISTFVRYHKPNYLEIIKDILSIMKDNGLLVNSCGLATISIFNPPKSMETAINKIEEYYDKDTFRFRDFNFNWQRFRLEKLEKYFDTVSDSISYIKKDHLEQFQDLKNKLSKK